MSRKKELIGPLFDDFEKEILDSAFYIMKNREDALNKLPLLGSSIGIEGWFTLELITNPKFQKWNVRKIQTPADLLINNKKVEIRSCADSNFSFIVKGLEEHPKADFILFLSNLDEKVMNEIANLDKSKYEIYWKRISHNWIVGLLKCA